MFVCLACGSEIRDAQKPSRKWCSDRCRKAAQRGGLAASRTPAPPVPGRPVTGLADAVAATVEQLGIGGTMRGELALELARRICDAPRRQNISGMSKQLQSVLAAAIRNAPPAPGRRLDQLRQRRDRKRRGRGL